ncbi:MAG: hypothetical protein Q4D44_02370 [Eubacteriales bacterium]|nr:hypothetical protein [Eubacteriales bacterium]
MDKAFNEQELFTTDSEEISREDWVSLPEPVTTKKVPLDDVLTDTCTELSDEKPPKAKMAVKSPVLTIQLIVCLLLLIFLFVSKTFLPNLYSEFKEIYSREISGTMISTGDFSKISYENFFSSTADEG